MIDSHHNTTTSKMLKTGFRGERKGILTPSLSQGEGECSDGKGGMWRVIYSISPRTPEGGQAGKGDRPPSLHIPSCREAHTQLLLATSKRGNMGTGKRL